MKKPKIHYSGEVITGNMRIIPGWAACCSGEKAERIRASGNNSTDPGNVTCAACKRVMAKDARIIFNVQHEDPVNRRSG